MQRLKLTTTKGKVFLSPFIYSNELAKKKLKSLGWLVKVREKAKLELVETPSYPKKALYTKDTESGDGHGLTLKVVRLEKLWNKFLH